jgi:hypothetical protein
MNLSRVVRNAGFLVFLGVTPLFIAAQTNCDEGAGPLASASPQGITQQQIIEKFAAKETLFKQARNNYTFRQDISVQEFDGLSVSGEYRSVRDITYDDSGSRVETVVFAPQPSLRQLAISREDEEDFRSKMAFVMTTEEIPRYNLIYAGQQHVDEVDTYVFDIAPKMIDKGLRYFQGRIWVESHDFQIVKTCGKTVPETVAGNSKKNKNVQENLSPTFVTYREQIDGEYWFPTYTRADDTLHFRMGDVRMREIIKYTDYKRFAVKSRIIYKGEVKDDSAQQPAKKP